MEPTSQYQNPFKVNFRKNHDIFTLRQIHCMGEFVNREDVIMDVPISQKRKFLKIDHIMKSILKAISKNFN